VPETWSLFALSKLWNQTKADNTNILINRAWDIDIKNLRNPPPAKIKESQLLEAKSE
jgi:hypothetical protein